MAMTGDIVAGAAWVKLLLDDKGLKAGLNTAQGKLEAFAATARQVGTQCMTLAAALAAPLMSVGKTFADFDDQMRTVAAVTGATGAQFDMLTDKAKKLGRETSFTAAEVAAGMTALGRMGFNAGDIDATIETIMNLAKATGTDLATAAEIASNNIRAFGLSAQDSRQVADILTTTANSSAQTLTDLGEALKMSAPAAHTAGESLKDVSAAIGVLANVGIRGSMAGNALKRAYSELAKESSQVYLERFGVKAVDATGNLRRMADVLRDCAVAMKDMGSAQKMEFATQVFGERAAGAALAISVDTSKLDEMMAKLEQANGSAEATATAMEAGIGGELRRLSSAAEGVALAFGKILAQAFGPTVKNLSTMATALAETLAHASPLVQVTLQFAAALLAVGVAIKVLTALKVAVVALLGPIKMLTAAMGGVAVAAPILAVALAAVVTVMAIAKANADEAAASFERLKTAQAEYAAAASQQRTEGTRRRRSDAEAFARLEELHQLSQQGKLTQEQLEEVEALYNRLARYNRSGNLGAFSAEDNGFYGWGKNSRKLFEADQRAEALAELSREYRAIGEQIKIADAATAAKLREKQAVLEELARKISGGDTYAARGQDREEEEARRRKAASDRSVEARKAAEAADEKLAAMNAEFLSQYDREIEKVNKLEAEYLALAAAKLKALQTQAQTGTDTAKEQAALTADIELRKKQYEAARANARQAKAQAEASYTGYAATYERGQAETAAEQARQKQLADAIKAGDTPTLTAIENRLKAEYAAAKSAYATALGQATAAESEGGANISSREGSALKTLQNAIKAAGDRLFNARNQIQNGQATAAATLGGYSGGALARMFAGGTTVETAEERARNAQLETAKNTKKLTEIFTNLRRA